MFVNIIKNFIFVYFTLCFSVFCHEIAHFMIAKIFHFKNIFVCVGLENSFGFRTKHFFISPFMVYGYVSSDDPYWKNRTITQVFFYYFSGIIVNIIFVVLGIIFHHVTIIYINTIIILASAIPVKLLNNDSYNFLNEYKKRREDNQDV